MVVKLMEDTKKEKNVGSKALIIKEKNLNKEIQKEVTAQEG